jgi:hypothetical protein
VQEQVFIRVVDKSYFCRLLRRQAPELYLLFKIGLRSKSVFYDANTVSFRLYPCFIVPSRKKYLLVEFTAPVRKGWSLLVLIETLLVSCVGVKSRRSSQALVKTAVSSISSLTKMTPCFLCSVVTA